MRYRSVLALAAVSLLCCASCSAATFDVRAYGAKADGTTDDTAAFQNALDAAAAKPGSEVHAPAGRYLIAGTIFVKESTTLRGDYPGQGRARGTVLLSTFGRGRSDGPGCIAAMGASGVRNIAIEYPDQVADAKQPVPYPYAITAMSGDLRIEDIFLYNAYQGINLDGCHANTVRGIWGEPLRIGINADHIYDISRIENVHFWPYFTLGKPLRDWVQRHGVAFQFGRSDWQYCLNTFSYGYHIGYRFYRSQEIKDKNWPGGTTNGNFVGIGADCAAICVDVEDCFAIGVSITNGEFAPFGGSNTRAILLHKGNTGNLTLTNCTFWAVTDSVAEVRDGSLNLTACNIHEWGVAAKEAPCFLVSGGRLNVQSCTFNKGGRLALVDGAATRAMFSGNMGTDPLTVTSRIGDRLVVATNNPAINAVSPEP